MAKGLNAETHLNGAVRVQPEAGHELPRDVVLCRHFVKEFVEHTGRKRNLVREFDSPQKISSRFEHRLKEMDTANRRARQLAEADSKHILREEQLGEYLAAVASALAMPAAGERTEANCLLESICHAMAIHVSRKSSDGADYFSVKVYDPNSTASYMRVESLGVESLRGLTLKDMLIAPEARERYSDTHDKSVLLLATCLNPQVRPHMDRSLTEATPDAMHLALCDGSLEDLRVILATLATNEIGSTEHSLFEVLSAKSVYSGWVGLHGALAYGYTDAVSAFISFVLSTSRLTASEKMELIASKDSRGMPGLHAALFLGNAPAVSAYANAVLSDSAMTGSDKATLLASKTKLGVPGLYVAFANGEASAVAAYANAVLSTSSLTEMQKIELLSAERATGRAGLATAVANGATEVVQAFVQAVSASDLCAAHKYVLLGWY